MLKQVGNLVADDVPPGGEDDYVVLETIGKPRDFAAEGFAPRDHLELGQLLGAIDTERGRQGVRLSLLLPDRAGRRARAGPDQPGHEHGAAQRVHRR